MSLDLNETFPHLSRAPIVEAIIDFRAKPAVQCSQGQFVQFFQEKLPEYSNIQVQNRVFFRLNLEKGQTPEPSSSELDWGGFMFREGNKHAAQFQTEGFTFSRLPPYEEWESFEAEALRLWDFFCELTKPPEIQRIGVRFINRMPFPADGFDLKTYFTSPPLTPPAFPVLISAFFHHSTYLVPGSIYQINSVQTVQPSEGLILQVPLILDIEVFTALPMALDGQTVQQTLRQMRGLKNKFFFASVTQNVIDSFK
jgi:uncharacterized protein (TIGR04255 family)